MYVPPRWTFKPSTVLQLASRISPSSSQTGCEKVMCADYAFAKECGFLCTRTSSVKKLIGNHKIHRRVFRLQTADRRHRQNIFDAEQLHRVDVRSIGNLSRREFMPASMTRQKSDRHALQLANNKRIRRRAKRSLDFLFTHILEFRHLIEPAAADDSDIYLFHYFCFSSGTKTLRSKAKGPSKGLFSDVIFNAVSLSALAFIVFPSFVWIADRKRYADRQFGAREIT